jgi:protein SCO1
MSIKHPILIAASIALMLASRFTTAQVDPSPPQQGIVAQSVEACPTCSVPEDSVYQLQSAFTDQDSRQFVLADQRGKVQLVAMFYSSCKYVCPLIINSARGVQKALRATERAKLQILLVSFDSLRDTPKQLKATASAHKLDLNFWTLARTERKAVRTLAALLSVRYREMPDGEFNHISQLILLDEQGRIIARTEKMTPTPDAEFLAKVQDALQKR